MTPAQLKRLEREWAAKLRADGHPDIESPSGMLTSALSHGVSTERIQAIAQLEADREGTPRLRFLQSWEERAWTLHLEGHSNREVAAKCCVYRKLVDQTFARLRRQMKQRPRKRPDSLRSEDLQLHCLLTPEAKEAFVYLRQVLPRSVSISAIVRRALVDLALRIPANPATCSDETLYIAWRKPGASPPLGGMRKAA